MGFSTHFLHFELKKVVFFLSSLIFFCALLIFVTVTFCDCYLVLTEPPSHLNQTNIPLADPRPNPGCKDLVQFTGGGGGWKVVLQVVQVGAGDLVQVGGGGSDSSVCVCVWGGGVR